MTTTTPIQATPCYLSTETMIAVYQDLRTAALALRRPDPERDRIARHMQRIRILLNQRGWEVRVTDTGDGYHTAEFVQVVA